MESFTHEPEKQSFDIGTSTLGTIALHEDQLVQVLMVHFFQFFHLTHFWCLFHSCLISESPNILDLLIQGHFCRIKKFAQAAAVYEQAVKILADRDCLIARRWRGESLIKVSYVIMSHGSRPAKGSF